MIFFRLFFFFQSDRLTRYQETHSTANENKKGDGLTSCGEDKQSFLVFINFYQRIKTTETNLTQCLGVIMSSLSSEDQ